MKHSKDFDNRWSPRQEIQLDISLRDNQQEILHTTSKNISIGGLLVAASSPPLAIDTPLHVAFTLRNADGEQQHSLPARIVRQHDNGTALAFSDYDIQTLNALRVLLYDGADTH